MRDDGCYDGWQGEAGGCGGCGGRQTGTSVFFELLIKLRSQGAQFLENGVQLSILRVFLEKKNEKISEQISCRPAVEGTQIVTIRFR